MKNTCLEGETGDGALWRWHAARLAQETVTNKNKPRKIMKTKLLLILIAAIATMQAAPSLRAASDDDKRIVSAAKQSYVYRTHLKDETIKLRAKDGAVTLTGTVASQSHKDMAQVTVENLPGVKSVENLLVVKPANEHSDDWLGMKIKSALLFHRSVSGSRTKVLVKGGVVTLSGTASSDAEKELASEYAKDIEGVKKVKNEMTVVVEPPARSLSEVVDDASVTAQVKGALFTHRSTSAVKTKVATRDGVVTVTGEVNNQAQKDLVTKLASDIHGVKNVVNNMVIKE